MAGAAEHGDLALNGFTAQTQGDAVCGRLASGELRQNGDAESGGDEGADGFQFAALTSDARL